MAKERVVQGWSWSGRYLAVALAATVANAALFFLSVSVGASMRINSSGYSEITALMVVLSTLFPLVFARWLTLLVGRRFPAFIQIALWLGLLVAVLSIPSPFFLSEDMATAFSLAAMHVVAGAAWFWGMSLFGVMNNGR
ncbi:DUF6069 family protein [Corynebacterium oculi]|uniref:Uncharacterized protein n=1 Tax=Corynebacterium oculi TaxID=1544416 RepID=A0A0N8VZN3_9CORY|nr:DUF6069 family protein [Corynebacterium oculi]KQB84378.1 hypothetical protein Cocul_01179 [Corynebacterium oculi]